MHTNVCEHLQRFIALTDHKYRSINDVPGNKVARLRHFRRAAQANPLPAEQMFYFEIENLGIMIDRGRQTFRITE